MSYSPIHDKYGFQHLSYHLSQAGLSDELYHLVVSKDWYQQSIDFDPSGRQYGEDVRWSFQATVEQIEAHLQTGHDSALASLLARPAALAWLSANFGQVAKPISTPLLEAMTRQGDVEQARRRAEMMPDPVRRAEALTRIGEAALTLGQHTEAREAWIRAQELLLSTPTDFFNEKLEILRQLTRALARTGQSEEVLSLAARLQVEVEAEIERAEGVTSTAYVALTGAWGALGDKRKALTAAKELTNAGDQITALCATAQGLFDVDERQALVVLDAASDLVSETRDKAALSALTLRLAEADGLPDAWRLVGDADTVSTRSRLLLTAARGAFRRDDPVTGEALLTEAIKAALTAEPEKDCLLLLAELASEGRLVPNEEVSTNLLGLLKERWPEFAPEWDSRALGTVALGLLALGDAPEAEAAVSAALKWKLPNDDWEENDALGELAGMLGEVGDSDGLAWILARARERRMAWQQAELANSVARAAAETGDTALACKAEQLMEAAALGKTRGLPGANAGRILAVWHIAKQNVATARQLVEQSVAELKESPDGAGALAYLALTLAQARCLSWPVTFSGKPSTYYNKRSIPTFSGAPPERRPKSPPPWGIRKRSTRSKQLPGGLMTTGYKTRHCFG